jgi:ELWxxDGT repeat protein
MKRFLFYSILQLTGTFAYSQIPILVKDINPGSGQIMSSESIAIDGKLFFNVSERPSVLQTNELWVSDGTAAGTIKLDTFIKAINVFGFTEMNHKLYFVADDGTHGYELWSSDGTPTGTRIVKDINPGYSGSFTTSYNSKYLSVMNGKLYFAADDGLHGNELWRSDGTDTGTYMVKDVNPDSGSISTNYHGPYNTNKVIGSAFYFTADDGPHGYELWVTDGTSTGTRMVNDINTNATDNNAYPNEFMSYNGKLYFTANSGATGYGLFVSDGSQAGTYMLYGGIKNNSDYTVLNNTLYFIAHVDDNTGNPIYGLWQTNGTAPGTMVIKDTLNSSFAFYLETFYPSRNQRKVAGLTQLNNKLYFTAGTLWYSDGTHDGTKPIRPLYIGNATFPTIAGSRIYFRSGNMLFQSDGTDSGTNFLPDPPGANYSGSWNSTAAYNNSPVLIGNQLFYINGYDDSVGTELYKIDIPTEVHNAEKTQKAVKTWPNPATNSVQLTVNVELSTYPPKSGTYSVSVANAIGQLVYSTTVGPSEKTMQIDVASWTNGIYFVMLNGAYAGKFVKE